MVLVTVRQWHLTEHVSSETEQQYNTILRRYCVFAILAPSSCHD